jgi:hypothetical protein
VLVAQVDVDAGTIIADPKVGLVFFAPEGGLGAELLYRVGDSLSGWAGAELLVEPAT